MTMREDLAASYTLVVPTYNRPAQLRRLLRYLELCGARFPVLVLDSSAPENRPLNADALASVKLRVRRVEYDSTMPPFEKFGAGTAMVDTPYLSLCADDDIVRVEALAPIVEFLSRNADHSAAHGFYFNFQEQGRASPPWRTTISSLFYRGPSIDAAQPAERLAQLLRRYEALTYAVYRTEVARRAYAESANVASILARELLSGALTVVAGKTARLKVIYYGRSTGPSAGYRNWHPLEWLATDPAGLFGEYAAYRAILLRALAERGATGDEAARLCDLAHLRYLSGFLDAGYLEFALERNLERLAPEKVISEVWRFWNERSARGWRGLARKVLPARRVASGDNRYRFEPAFLYAGPRREVRVTRREIDAIVSCLDSYSTAQA
jgi:glycosyltransferase domain-containing protein